MGSLATISTTILTTTTTKTTKTTSLTSLLTKPHSLTFPNSRFHPLHFLSSTPHTPIIPKSTTDDAAIAGATTATPLSSRNLKSRLRNGETLYGLFLLSFSPTLAEIAGYAGYDFVVVDMEHGHGGISDALPCLHALAASGSAAILRVPETTATWAKKALDLGPQGIMFPMIDSPEWAQKAVSYCRFPPSGLRGTAHPVVRASKYGIDEGYIGNYLAEVLIMCQVESEEGVKNVGEIVAVDGVDCVQMGPLDLSASLGYLWDPGNKNVRDVMREAERKVLESKNDDVERGAYLAGFAMPHDGPKDMRSRGYRMVAGAVDVGLFRNAAVDDVMSFKMSMFENGSESDDGEGKEGDDKYWSE